MAQTRRLSRSELRELGSIIESDNLAAQEWWYDNAPSEYLYIFEAVQFSTLDEIPNTNDEFRQWMLENYPGELSSKRARLWRLWVVGGIFFFVGGYYYSKSRQRTSPISLRGAYDRTVEASRNSVLEDCRAFREGRISLAQWQTRVVSWVKAVNIAGAAIGAGGFQSMTGADWDTVAKNIEEQLDYLNAFAREIEAGLPLDGNVCRRMFMYLQSGRSTLHEIESGHMAQRGFTHYANRLTAAEHCEGDGSCVEETAKGWVPIGQLIPIGARLCLTGCKCYFAYLNMNTGELDERN